MKETEKYAHCTHKRKIKTKNKKTTWNFTNKTRQQLAIRAMTIIAKEEKNSHIQPTHWTQNIEHKNGKGILYTVYRQMKLRTKEVQAYHKLRALIPIQMR